MPRLEPQDARVGGNKQSATVGAAYIKIMIGILEQRATLANIINIMQCRDMQCTDMALHAVHRQGVNVRSGVRKDSCACG